jgi:hypothetical protein
MAEIGSINSSSPAQAFQRPNSAGGGGQGQDSGGSNPVEDRVQISSAGRDQNTVQSQAQEASVREGAGPSVDERIEANADPARNSTANQDIETEVSDIQEANTQNSAAPPEQNVSTLQREQAEQSSNNGALSSAQSSVEERGQSVDQLA